MKNVGLGLLLAGGLLSLLGVAQSAAAGDVVKVNESVITEADVERAWVRTNASKRNLSANEAKMYRQHITELLIDDMLIRQCLDQQKITTDEKAVDDHVAQFAKQLEQRGKTLQSFLKEHGVAEAEMREDIRNMYRWITFVNGQATDSTLRKYFEVNKSAFDGSMTRASHILVKCEADATEAERQAASAKIAAIQKELAAGKAFAAVAKENSDCPSKENGGDLDMFPRKGVMTEPFAAAAFDLKIGHTSGVVQTEFGYHLIKVTDRKPGKDVKFEDVKDEVGELYGQEFRQAIIAQMRKKADIQMLR